MEQKIGFKNKPLSEWVPETQPKAARNWNAAETRALFVDERTCIGCKNCMWQAPESLVMDPEHGRARVVKQWASTEEQQQAAVGAHALLTRCCSICVAPSHPRFQTMVA